MSNDTKTNVTEIPTPTAIDEAEFSAAEAEAAASAHTFTYTLPKPFTYEGKTYEELTFDWGKLTGNDSMAIEGEVNALGKAVITPEFSSEYLVRMAARACTVKIDIDVLLAMPLASFNKIRAAARSFLLKSGS